MPATPCNLSIDSGMNIGWALWTVADWDKLVPPYDAGSGSVPEVGTWQGKVCIALRRFENMMARYNVQLDNVYIEWPEFERGNTAKLCFTVGWLSRWAVVSRRAQLHLVGVNEWKGQLKKQQTDQRIGAYLGRGALKGYNDHTRDAIGIGLHCKGFEFG